MPRRYALIRTTSPDAGRVVAAYLPDNYYVTYTGDDCIIVSGDDSSGWTLNDYVIPRLASGNIIAQEINFNEALEIAKKGLVRA